MRDQELDCFSFFALLLAFPAFPFSLFSPIAVSDLFASDNWLDLYLTVPLLLSQPLESICHLMTSELKICQY